MGHSFGAFIASKYALLFPHNTKKVAFFSPWASETTSEENINDLEERFDKMPFFKRQLFKIAKKWYRSKGTPFSIARKAGRLLGGYFIKKTIKGRLSSLSDDEKELYAEYSHHIIMNTGSSEKAMNIMFPHFNVSEYAISNYLDEYLNNDIEISFYYGSHDWMNTSYNGDYISKQLRKAGHKVYIIKDAGHHLYMDNPEEALEAIFDDFEIS